MRARSARSCTGGTYASALGRVRVLRLDARPWSAPSLRSNVVAERARRRPRVFPPGRAKKTRDPMALSVPWEEGTAHTCAAAGGIVTHTSRVPALRPEAKRALVAWSVRRVHVRSLARSSTTRVCCDRAGRPAADAGVKGFWGPVRAYASWTGIHVLEHGALLSTADNTFLDAGSPIPIRLQRARTRASNARIPTERLYAFAPRHPSHIKMRQRRGTHSPTPRRVLGGTRARILASAHRNRINCGTRKHTHMRSHVRTSAQPHQLKDTHVVGVSSPRGRTTCPIHTAARFAQSPEQRATTSDAWHTSQASGPRGECLCPASTLPSRFRTTTPRTARPAHLAIMIYHGCQTPRPAPRSDPENNEKQHPVCGEPFESKTPTPWFRGK